MKQQGKNGQGIYGELTPQEQRFCKGLQQTTTGSLIENFYLLRVKGVITKDSFNSPYVDCQIRFCNHDVPAMNLGESQLKNMEEAQEVFVKQMAAEDGGDSVDVNS